MKRGGSKSAHEQIRREYNWDDVSPVVAIIESIAELEYGDASETTEVLDQPLQTYVDVEALDTLVRSESTLSITLQVSHYHIQIHRNTVGVSLVDEGEL